MSELLTVGEVAQLFKVSRITIFRWAKSGELKSLKLGAGSVRFRPEDVEEFIRAAEQERNRVPSFEGRAAAIMEPKQVIVDVHNPPVPKVLA